MHGPSTPKHLFTSLKVHGVHEAFAEKTFGLCGLRDFGWLWGVLLEEVVRRNKEKWSVIVAIEHVLPSRDVGIKPYDRVREFFLLATHPVTLKVLVEQC